MHSDVCHAATKPSSQSTKQRSRSHSFLAGLIALVNKGRAGLILSAKCCHPPLGQSTCQGHNHLAIRDTRTTAQMSQKSAGHDLSCCVSSHNGSQLSCLQSSSVSHICQCQVTIRVNAARRSHWLCNPTSSRFLPDASRCGAGFGHSAVV